MTKKDNDKPYTLDEEETDSNEGMGYAYKYAAQLFDTVTPTAEMVFGIFDIFEDLEEDDVRTAREQLKLAVENVRALFGNATFSAAELLGYFHRVFPYYKPVPDDEE